MPITFQCRNCRREVKAPESAAGRMGRCPFCGQTNRIPVDLDEDDGIPLAPIDEEEERRTRRELRALYEQEQELLSVTGGPQPIPLEHRDDLTSEDLYHLVVNYCLDMAEGRLQRAAQYVEQLKRHGWLGAQAVEDFITGTNIEPVLDDIPRPVLQGFLRELMSAVT